MPKEKSKKRPLKREFSAGGIVYNTKTKKFLLIKDSYGRWALPKGLIEKGETAQQAALREVEEETGLKNLKIVKRLGEINYFYTLKGQRIFKIVIFFLMETEQTHLKPQWEICGAKWFKPEQALEKISYTNSKAIIKKAIKCLT